MEHGQFWRNKELREHISVIDEKLSPTIILKNGVYLNVFTKMWLEANIWIYHDRIIYVGEKLPENLTNVEVVDCTGQYLVPGYVETHAHPFQLHNPEELGHHAGKYGTTTLINDNLGIFNLKNKKKALSLIDAFHELPISMFWWGRYDSQTALRQEELIYTTADLFKWLEHPAVVQGGELTAWPELLAGDDRLLYWIQKTNQLKKPVEGHLAGASKEVLTKLKLFGVSSDHEALTGQEVLDRLEQGYHVALRYSSLRSDLPDILTDLEHLGLNHFDDLSFTTDASSPKFIEKGLINLCIDIAIMQGVPLVEAYRMGSYNAAKHIKLDDVVGSIAPGKIANINILYDKSDPNPLSVIAKGEWLVKEGYVMPYQQHINWSEYKTENIKYDWDLSEDDLQFSIPIGLKVESDIIMKPYAVGADITTDILPDKTPDAFLLLIDQYGKWRVNSVINGFTDSLGGLASSYSTTGDVIFIGKNKDDILIAAKRLKEIGGGIVLVDQGEIIYELKLALNGTMFIGGMETLINKEKEFNRILNKYGYPFENPLFNLLYLSATSIPYLRITQQGLYDVVKRETIVPANMR
ncbi:MAG TPA: adenine deaminase C-terminal domain-containing protein [Pseudogracilibacillus sp.]|nr:adenine deaminase C-terminal domain-containing protein [Pseudogracilibacillus sp.]